MRWGFEPCIFSYMPSSRGIRLIGFWGILILSTSLEVSINTVGVYKVSATFYRA